ncbi:MAG: cytidylate kinase-like family protein [Prevotellaceae bacterium]|jgi:cytidylate kinase|nr:cytidylate kinase-like family protein [Prevotellaceae bacterium]
MDKIVLSIGRQFGSGGGEIGRRLAKELNISYYDKELLAIAAQESGLCPEVFEKADERESTGLSYAFSSGFSPLGMYIPYDDILSNEKLFLLQSETIRNLAEKESCVIIGRCSDYILRDNPDCLSFFIHNTLDNRIKHITERENVTETRAKELIVKADKSRAAYYSYYTNKLWGVASSYNFSVDVSVLGTEGTVSLLKDMIINYKRKKA